MVALTLGAAALGSALPDPIEKIIVNDAKLWRLHGHPFGLGIGAADAPARLWVFDEALSISDDPTHIQGIFQDAHWRACDYQR